MKQFKRLLSLLLAAAMCVMLFASALAADDPYTYTVRILSGAQGTFDGKKQDKIIYSGLHYGERVTFSPGSVQVAEKNKYYVRGIRESGKDNSTVSNSSFVVTGDMDLVVAYGILGNSVAYTIRYEDEKGRSLHDLGVVGDDGKVLPESITYYGNAGDRMVTSYLYADGYQPIDAYNLRKTLSANAKDNVFVFRYRKLGSGQQENGNGNNANNAGNGNNSNDHNNGQNQTEDGQNDGNGGEDNAHDGTVAEDGGNGGSGDRDGGEDGEPQEIIDLDDGQIPATEPAVDEDGDSSGEVEPDKGENWLLKLPMGVKVGVSLLLLLTILLAAWLLKRRKKSHE